jgi:hypothetical protein
MIIRIDPITIPFLGCSFDQITAQWSLIDRVIGAEIERALSNPGWDTRAWLISMPTKMTAFFVRGLSVSVS